MLDLRYLTDSFEEAQGALLRRGAHLAALLDAVARKARERRELLTRLETKRASLNQANQEMAKLDKASAAFAAKRDELRRLSGEVKDEEEAERRVEAELSELALQVPNAPHASVPNGSSEHDNPVVRTWGEKPTLSAPRDHVDVGERIGIFDFQRAAKLSGARFCVLSGAGARLERALINFMLDLHTRTHGYHEFWTPVLVRASALQGTGQLPKFEADLFRIADASTPPLGDVTAEAGDKKAPSAEKGAAERREPLYLIPTAEVTLTNLHANEIFTAAQLPLAYTAYTPCFRSEAGSYGKDTRGFIRQHQFDKIELVRFVTPDQALEQLELLTNHAEEVLRRLELHYRVIELCTADLGFASQKTYDLEVWLPGQNAYREISSCSWFGDFQARRAKIRFRTGEKAKPQLVHTLNGSGLAVGRTLVAILEQCQQEDGSVRIPKALQPFCDGLATLQPTT